MLAGLIRAPNALLAVPQSGARRERARHRAGAPARRRDHHSEASTTPPLGEPLRTAPPPRARQRGAVLRRLPARGAGAQIYPPRGADLGRPRHLHQPRPAAAAAGRRTPCADGLAELERRYPRSGERDPRRACRLRSSRCGRRPARSRPWSAGATTRRRSSTAPSQRAAPAGLDLQAVRLPRRLRGGAEQRRDPITPTTAPCSTSRSSGATTRSTWRPSNYREQYLGSVTVRQALEMSLNAATARLAQQVGLEPILDARAPRSASSSALPPYPSVVLGAVEVTPLEVAQAYAVLANQGLRATLRGVEQGRRSRRPDSIERRPLEVERVVSPQAAYLVTHLMEGVLDRGTGRGARDRGFTPPGGRQDGHDQRRARRLVRRLHARPARRRLGRFRRGAQARPDRRRGGAADLDRLHDSAPPPGSPRRPSCRRPVLTWCDRPVHGRYRDRRLPRDHRSRPSSRGQDPTAPCPLHVGLRDRSAP